MKALIHIGTPKAGSTSIQHFFIQNAAALAERDVHYLPPDKGDRGNHEVMHAGFALSGQDLSAPNLRNRLQGASAEDVPAQVDAYRASLDALVRASETGTYFASDELIFSRLDTVDGIGALHDLLSEYFTDIRYLCYLRPPEDWILSRYSQALRGGTTLSLDDYAREQSAQLDFAPVLARWAEAVGQDKQVVRLLDREEMVGGDLISDVLALMDARPDGLQPVQVQNEAFDRATSAFARHVNVRLAGGALKSETETVRRAVVKRLNARGARGAKLRLPHTAISHIQQETAGQMEAIRAMYFPDRPVLFRPKPAQDSVDDPADLTFDEAAEIAMQLLPDIVTDEKLQSRLGRARPTGKNAHKGARPAGRRAPSHASQD